ncbi:MAG TPA: CCE_0567 family metalloprotein [Campylobacterales bacterium]|nr:CCE_0567 family metalloprotein [Campylobacterales bacterium]
MSEEDPKKELATLKRKASEIASKMHDIVEDALWSEYKELRPLAEELIEACEKYTLFKKEHSL